MTKKTRTRRIDFILENQADIVGSIDFPFTREQLEDLDDDTLDAFYSDLCDQIAQAEQDYEDDYLYHGRAQ